MYPILKWCPWPNDDNSTPNTSCVSWQKVDQCTEPGEIGALLRRKGLYPPDYDQVSRTAACIIHAILESENAGERVAQLVVLYPADKKIHPDQ